MVTVSGDTVVCVRSHVHGCTYNLIQSENNSHTHTHTAGTREHTCVDLHIAKVYKYSNTHTGINTNLPT